MRFQNLLIALDIKDNKRKRALLLHYMGESTLNIFETLPETGTADEYDKACEVLNAYFKLRKNTSFEIFKFRRRTKTLMRHLINTTYDLFRKLSTVNLQIWTVK